MVPLAEFEKIRATAVHRERDESPNAADPVMPAKNVFWDFIPFENDAECGGATFCKPRKNHWLQKTAPHRRRSCIFDSQCDRTSSKRADTVDSEGGEEFEGTLRKDHRENLSSEIPISNARCQTSEVDTMKEKPKILQSSTSNVASSHGRSMKEPVDEPISNVYPAEKGRNDKEESIEKIDFSLLRSARFVNPFYRDVVCE